MERTFGYTARFTARSFQLYSSIVFIDSPGLSAFSSCVDMFFHRILGTMATSSFFMRRGEFIVNPFSSHVQNNEQSNGKFCTRLLSFVPYKSCQWCVAFVCREKPGLHTSTNTERKSWKQKWWMRGRQKQSETKVGQQLMCGFQCYIKDV